MQPTPPNNQSEDPASTALTLAEQQISALARPGQAVTLISEALDFIAEEGPNAEAIMAIGDGTQQLLDTITVLDTAFKSAMVAAKAIQEQRKEALSSLDDLRKAIKTQNRMIPEIDDLVSDIFEEAHEDAYYELDDMFSENLIDDITQSTPLHWHEAAALVEILQGANELPNDDPAWAELKAWIKHAEEDRNLVRFGETTEDDE